MQCSDMGRRIGDSRRRLIVSKLEAETPMPCFDGLASTNAEPMAASGTASAIEFHAPVRPFGNVPMSARGQFLVLRCD